MAAAASCELKAKDGGYYLVLAKGKDSKKRAVEAAIGLYGIGSGNFSWGDNDRAALELVPNKKKYHVGDTAQILIKSPFKEAEALVTVERAGVYHAERVKLRGATPTVSVRVTSELAPNAFVAVHLIVPRGAGKQNASGASFRYGYAELPIDPEARRLSVKVKPVKSELLPGQQAEVELSVSDRAGKGVPAELTVYAVDEGVLMLTGYRTPDPVPVFGASRPLKVALLETRAGLAKIKLSAFDLLGEDKGADGGGGGFGEARRDFRQVALFEPKLLTDQQGRARVRFKLPDQLTSYRVMAVAVSRDDRYGFGDSRITASKPLMVRPALPRFLRAGDRFEAAAVIAAKGIAPGKVSVKLEMSGAELEGPAERQIELGKDATQEVRFALRTERAGLVKIGFSATSTLARDAVVLERKVQVPSALETIAVYGQTSESKSEKLGDMSKLRSDSGGLEVTLASSALIGVETGLEDLVDYPYGCTEQLTSRLLPLGPLSDLARAFALPLPKNTELVRDRTVAQILARQLGDGGFGMWPESTRSSEWVTPYVLWVLEETRKSGAPVPASALERGRAYLRRWLAENMVKGPETAAFVVDALAELGSPDPGYAEKLWQRRAALPTFARGLLLHALALGKSPPSMADSLARELENSLRITGNTAKVVDNVGDEYAELLDSPTRTSAIVMRGLLAYRPAHPLAAQLARGLLQSREQGHWRSTQETAFSLVALEAYRRAQERAAPAFTAQAQFGERSLLTLGAQGRGLHAERAGLDMAALLQGQAKSVTFQKTGDGELFYELRLKYAPRTLPDKALDAGFFVKKTLRAVKASELSSALESVPESGVTRFAAGDLVIADLVVVAPTPSNYLVIDDPLPAGFEAIDSNLATTASWLAVPSGTSEPESDDRIAHGRAYLDVWQRRELRDDRALFFVDHLPAGMVHFRYLARATTLGSFLVPPTKAEEMYEPETFGRTAASRIEVH
ncbi:MAG TPA: alpha-2-macroglobulin family protein, partial [Polyangiaceae bacterium]|nr:alpha-2-macroglobulin family protein [Polyangiaceae bacterium]